jgi:tetratricopeptide (TPR) repeat protein
VREIRQVCESCHSALSKPTHTAVTECVSCHMPRLSPDDIPHAASTDHRILRRPAPLFNRNAGEPEISAYQDPPAEFRNRDLAVAAIVVGSQHGLAPVRDKGIKLLEGLPEDVKNSDASVISSLIAIYVQQRESERAKALAQRATEVQPDSGYASLNLALALENSGDNAAAERQYLHTIDLDPSLQGAWTNLVFMYDRMGRQADKLALLNRYLQWNPQSIWFRQLRGMASPEH